MITPDVIEQVALVTGRILHEGTGKAVFGHIHITAQEGLVTDKLLTDGTFVVSSRPELLFPNLGSQNYQLNLTIRADSPQYRASSFQRQLSVAIPMGSTFDIPIDVGTILLPADPVNIRGRVVEAANPDTPILNATVQVLQGAAVTNWTTTNNDGRYRFENITVLAAAEIQCSKANFKTQKRTLLIDFGKLINEEYFRLGPP
jgi:hypothetical protein